MTAAEIAFYRRRQREELRKAETGTEMSRKHVHLQWARYFAAKLEGQRANKPRVPEVGPISLADLAA